MEDGERFETAVPFYDLAAAASSFTASQSPASLGWIRLPRRRRVRDPSVFAAKVVGKSMEPGIPDDTLALFRAFPAGTAPPPTALDNRRVVVELREASDGELGGRYTLKRWRVTQVDARGRCTEVELRPDNPSYRTLRLGASGDEVRVVAEFLERLS